MAEEKVQDVEAQQPEKKISRLRARFKMPRLLPRVKFRINIKERLRLLWLAFKNILKVAAGLLLLGAVIVGGFFLGAYLRVFDVDTVNAKLELYKYPVLSEYFTEPVEKPQEETPPAEAESAAPEAKPAAETSPAAAAPAQAAVTPSKPVILTKEEIDRQTKLRQAEEKKRVSKLARLYGEMKPEDAAAILDGLGDDMVVAILGRMDEGQVSKLLTAFEAGRSARLTRIMYNGQPAALPAVSAEAER